MEIPRTYLVLGANGFLGRHVAAALEQERQNIVALGYRALSQEQAKDPRAIEVDLSEPESVQSALQETNPNSVILCAGAHITSHDGSKVYTTFTRQVTDGIGRYLSSNRTSAHGIPRLSRLTTVGSCKQYASVGGSAIAEDAPLIEDGNSDGARKTQEMRLAQTWGEEQGVTVTTAIMGNPIGERPPRYQLWPLVAQRAAAWRDGRQFDRLTVTVEDSRGLLSGQSAGAGIAMLANPDCNVGHGSTFNVSGGETVTMGEALDEMFVCMASIKGLAGIQSSDIYLPKAGKTPYPASLDTARIAALGWKETVTWREAMDRLVAAEFEK